MENFQKNGNGNADYTAAHNQLITQRGRRVINTNDGDSIYIRKQSM